MLKHANWNPAKDQTDDSTNCNMGSADSFVAHLVKALTFAVKHAWATGLRHLTLR